MLNRHAQKLQVKAVEEALFIDLEKDLDSFLVHGVPLPLEKILEFHLLVLDQGVEVLSHHLVGNTLLLVSGFPLLIKFNVFNRGAKSPHVRYDFFISLYWGDRSFIRLFIQRKWIEIKYEMVLLLEIGEHLFKLRSFKGLECNRSKVFL